MNLNGISPVCLHNSLTQLKPDKIALLSQTKKEIADFCHSNSLWKDRYYHQFPTYGFQTKKRYDNVDWLSRYAKRYAIMSNIKSHKPKVKSFVNDKIINIKTLTNAFAYNTSDSISIVVYDYFDNECLYEQAATFKVKNKDFVFLDTRTLISVDEDSISIFDLEKHQKVTEHQVHFGTSPHIQPIDSTSFAVISNGQCIVYDVKQQLNRKCTFIHNNDVIGTASDGQKIYIASEKDLTAHDTSNPRGPILWNYIQMEGAKFCSFNVKSKRALFGNKIINLNNGVEVSQFHNDDTVCGAIANDHIAVFGCSRRAVIFFDYVESKVVGQYQFSVSEGIKSIDSAITNDNVAVAADFNIKILKLPDKDGNVEEIRKVNCGSIGQRKTGEIDAVKQVVFDGERLITNMNKFVRVYDFYTGKTL
ncbi:hypothetical protein TRFO_21963 [Tritrichomonas foetus]|uniref:F-box domain containing protein n=1 Tax=Tritrichomonas foetus TaxID=1144522 RepID=A0A1J4KE85_9EUKA|nr:hypothetical protein TRFO_21963 [Tritrichomonas foetus]|eukprot:OHT09224.1 hypothetical protein TRFO_21963 [Tritrichomonas foetus]